MHLARRPEAAHLASTQATRLPRRAFCLTSSLEPFDGPFCEAGLAGWLAILTLPWKVDVFLTLHFEGQLIGKSSFGALLRFLLACLLACLRTLFRSLIPVSCGQLYSTYVYAYVSVSFRGRFVAPHDCCSRAPSFRQLTVGKLDGYPLCRVLLPTTVYRCTLYKYEVQGSTVLQTEPRGSEPAGLALLGNVYIADLGSCSCAV